MTKKATVQNHALKVLKAFRDERHGDRFAGLISRLVHYRVEQAMGEKVGKALVRRALRDLEGMDLVRDQGNGRKSYWIVTTREERAARAARSAQREQRERDYVATRRRLEELDITCGPDDLRNTFVFTPSEMIALLGRVR